MRWQTSCCCLHDRDDPEHVNMRSGKPAVHFQSRYRSPSPSCVPRRVRPAMRYFHLGQRLPLPAASGPPPPPWSSASVCAIGRHPYALFPRPETIVPTQSRRYRMRKWKPLAVEENERSSERWARKNTRQRRLRRPRLTATILAQAGTLIHPCCI